MNTDYTNSYFAPTVVQPYSNYNNNNYYQNPYSMGMNNNYYSPANQQTLVNALTSLINQLSSAQNGYGNYNNVSAYNNTSYPTANYVTTPQVQNNYQAANNYQTEQANAQLQEYNSAMERLAMQNVLLMGNMMNSMMQSSFGESPFASF